MWLDCRLGNVGGEEGCTGREKLLTIGQGRDPLVVGEVERRVCRQPGLVQLDGARIGEELCLAGVDFDYKYRQNLHIRWEACVMVRLMRVDGQVNGFVGGEEKCAVEH